MVSNVESALQSSRTRYVEGKSIVYLHLLYRISIRRVSHLFCNALHCCIAAGLQTANATKRQFCLNPSNLTRCGSANATSCCFSPFNRQINCHSILNRQTSNFELNERSMYNNDNGKQEVQQRRCMGIIRVL